VSKLLEQCRIVGDRILLRQKNPDRVTRGGIVIPEVATKRVNQGTVVKSNTKDIPAGAEVLYSPFGGIPVTLAGQEYLVLDPQDILLVLSTC